MQKMPEIRRLRIDARAESLPEAAEWIDAFCEAHAPAADIAPKLQLAVEELLLNSASHGYGAEREDGQVWLTLHPQPEGAALVVEDEGKPFDPLGDGPEPDTDASVEDRPVGGLGLLLVREMADKSAYHYHAPRNRLELVYGPGPLPGRKNL